MGLPMSPQNLGRRMSMYTDDRERFIHFLVETLEEYLEESASEEESEEYTEEVAAK